MADKMKHGRQGESVANSVASFGASLGSIRLAGMLGNDRLDMRGHVRRAKTLAELDFDDTTPYADDYDMTDALQAQAWGYTL